MDLDAGNDIFLNLFIVAIGLQLIFSGFVKGMCWKGCR